MNGSNASPRVFPRLRRNRILHARRPVVPAAGALRTALVVLVLADPADAGRHYFGALDSDALILSKTSFSGSSSNSPARPAGDVVEIWESEPTGLLRGNPRPDVPPHYLDHSPVDALLFEDLRPLLSVLDRLGPRPADVVEQRPAITESMSTERPRRWSPSPTILAAMATAWQCLTMCGALRYFACIAIASSAEGITGPVPLPAA
jgi:hypothetical protein